jgi:FkbM family methyltransferase
VLQKDPGLALYNFNGYGDYWNQLRSNEMGTICTWAVKWYSVVFLNDGLCLHPQKSLTKNIGADGSGTHFKSYNATLTNQSITPQVAVQKIELKEKEEHRMMFLAYYKESIKKESGLDKIFARMLNPIKKRLKNRFSHFFDKEASELHRIQKLPTNRIFTTTIFGNPITVQSAVGFRFLYKELFESNLYKFKSDTDKPRIIDCGANIGVSIIYFKKLFPQSTIIAFEADPYINQICNDNIRSLNLQNVTLHNFALWDEDGETFFETNSNDAGRVVGKEGEKAAVISVKTRRLSHFLEEKTDFLKIDIEGAETKVLTECNYLLKNVKALFIKYHAFKNQEDTLPEILGILKQNNFDYFISTPYVINRTPLESQRFDGALRSLVNIHAIQKGVL